MTGATIGDLDGAATGRRVDEDFFAEQVPDRGRRSQRAGGIYWDPLRRYNRPIGASWYEPGEGACLTASGYETFDSYG